MFTNEKREGKNTFVCAVSLYVAETPKASIKYHKTPSPIKPFGIVAYGFVGQPFSRQLYNDFIRRDLECLKFTGLEKQLPVSWAYL